MFTKKPLKKTNLNFKIFLTSIFLIFIFSLSISSNASASCGDGTIDSGEECDFATNGLDSCRSKNSWCNNECKCQAWCVPNCECAKNLTAGQSCSDGCGQSCYGSIPKPANTCGNDIKEGSEECDFNAAFGPYPNQCANNGPCNQATCTCDTGNQNPAPTSSPTPNQNPIEGCTDTCYCATKTPIGQTCSDSAGNVTCDGTTSGMGVGNPTEYVTIHDRYVRAGTKEEERNICGMTTGAYRQISGFSATYEAFYGGPIPQMRMFIPPGTITTYFNIQGCGPSLASMQAGAPDGRVAMTRHQQLPITPLPRNYYSIVKDGRLADFEAGDYFSTQKLQGDLDIMKDSFGYTPLPISRGGWLYSNIGNIPVGCSVWYNHFFVQVDTEIYNDWWDHYGSNPDGSINWDKDVESVMTYVAPSEPTKTTPKTPTCKANFSKTEITAPGESKLSFSSENTTKLIGSCTGPWPIEELELPLSYTDYAFPFTINQTGTETCTFTPYNGTTKGESCSATVTVKKSTASTPTPTPSPAKPKPADYVTLHDAYTRAPEDNKVYDSNTGIWTGEYSQYYSFTQNVTTSHGLIEKFRAFIPPGTVLMGLSILNDGKHGAVARYKIPPSAEPIGYSTDYNTHYTIDQLIAGDCIVAQNNHTELPIAGDGFPASLKTNRADWLYVKVGGGGAFNYHDTHFTVRVDIETYNAWWDKYIKDEAGWNKYIENVETYIDPTTEIQTSPTPTPAPTSTTSPTSTPKACQRDNPDCEKSTCNNVYCFDGCERIKGTRVCDGK